MCRYLNKNNNTNNLLLTLKNDKINDNIFSNNNSSPHKTLLGGLFSTLSRFDTINKNIHISNNIDNNIYIDGHKKMNTIEANKNIQEKYNLLTESKEDNNSFFNFVIPYKSKKPINQNISYNKKNTNSNSLYNSKIYLKKTSNSINKIQNSPFKLLIEPSSPINHFCSSCPEH